MVLKYTNIMTELAGRNIVLGVCGGIAAYKSAYLVRELSALGAKVRVVMTRSALSFMTPLTFQALSGEDVRSELFDSDAERAMGHIELARWADYLVIAPASANFIAKMAHGLADDLLSTLYLATSAPVIVCPAMNQAMWSHPATQANCDLLRKRGVMLVGPEEGSQACGDTGLGRLAEVDTIIAGIRLYPLKQVLQGRHVLITAGPTQEAIDPVRYLTNRSSGKMGYALAQAAQIAGARVTLISGPSGLTVPVGVDCIRVRSAQEMLTQVMQHVKSGVIYIGAAAVADYYVPQPATDKLKRQGQDALILTLKKNPDILAAVVASKLASMVIGFAAETSGVLRHAEEKRLIKCVDMMIANQVGENLGFDSDLNQVTIMTKEGHFSLNLAHKITVAGQIMMIVAEYLQAMRTSNESCYSN